MDILIEELTTGIPDTKQCIQVILRILTAAVLGAVVGFERQKTGKEAGMRTHMLVCIGAALLVIAPLESDMTSSDVSRIIQGLITGIGFLGGGTIIKLHEKREVKGMTTAAGIWMTAAIGITAGLGRLGLAILATFLTWTILYIFEFLVRSPDKNKSSHHDSSEESKSNANKSNYSEEE